MQGIPQHQENCHVNCIPPPDYFVFKNEIIKVKVKYGFDLHTGLAGSHHVWTGPPFYLRIITSYLKIGGIPCICFTLDIVRTVIDHSREMEHVLFEVINETCF